MKLQPSYLILFILLLLATHGDCKKPVAGKEAAWVTITKIDYNKTNLDDEAQDGYVDLLYDKQFNINEHSVYCRKAIRILTEAGIQNSSEVSVNYDPSYEELIFHTINIRRGDKIINQLSLSKIKTIQQEKDLHRFLYDGSLSAILFLEDVRKDDIIEYSYTIKGANPIFEGHFSTTLSLNYGIPIYNLNYKLIAPSSKTILLKNNNSTIKPVIETGKGNNVYTWALQDIKSMQQEDGTPASYDPYSTVQVSDYASWKEVNAWAMRLFPVVQPQSTDLQKKITEIKSTNADPEQQILSALRFVQDDIRYMGIEMGVGSHKPGNPDKICSQRFGDCKDKSYLLCTMLRQLGFNADPVLINAEAKNSITEMSPSATVFDHTTVRLSYNNSYYWFDPTISFQRGGLKNISYPDYQYGLVVSPGTTELTKINSKEPGLVKVSEVFDILNMAGKTRLTVTTTQTGSYADDTRSSFKSTSNKEMLKDYQDYYAAYYEHIIADSITYSDNDSTGVFITKEYYSINNIWEIENHQKTASFGSFVINGILKKPKDQQNRLMPFALTFPAHYKETVEINVPEDWEGSQSFKKVNTDAFILTCDFAYHNKKFTLSYDYECKKDAVSPDEIKEFITGMNTKENEMGYSLTVDLNDMPLTTRKTQASDNDNQLRNNVAVIALIVGFIGFFIWRFRNR
ncbi:MAG: DUF3857 domain-containing protein [Chitinophagaceae bacterium]